MPPVQAKPEVTFATVGAVLDKRGSMRRHLLTLACLMLLLPAARAQPFKLQCEVEGKWPEGTPRVAPARVTIELQVIGRHLYFTVIGPTHYAMRVSTLVSEDFKGENLTSSSQIGARRMERSTSKETELLIERGSMELSAHNDVSLAGKVQRFTYAGKCRPA